VQSCALHWTVSCAIIHLSVLCMWEVQVLYPGSPNNRPIAFLSGLLHSQNVTVLIHFNNWAFYPCLTRPRYLHLRYDPEPPLNRYSIYDNEGHHKSKPGPLPYLPDSINPRNSTSSTLHYCKGATRNETVLYLFQVVLLGFKPVRICCLTVSSHCHCQVDNP
jgi:hypothetical protein